MTAANFRALRSSAVKPIAPLRVKNRCVSAICFWNRLFAKWFPAETQGPLSSKSTKVMPSPRALRLCGKCSAFNTNGCGCGPRRSPQRSEERWDLVLQCTEPSKLIRPDRAHGLPDRHCLFAEHRSVANSLDRPNFRKFARHTCRDSRKGIAGMVMVRLWITCARPISRASLCWHDRRRAFESL